MTVRYPELLSILLRVASKHAEIFLLHAGTHMQHYVGLT